MTRVDFQRRNGFQLVGRVSVGDLFLTIFYPIFQNRVILHPVLGLVKISRWGRVSKGIHVNSGNNTLRQDEERDRSELRVRESTTPRSFGRVSKGNASRDEVLDKGPIGWIPLNTINSEMFVLDFYTTTLI